MAKDAELSLKIEDEELVIRIGISTLAFAATKGPYFDNIVMDHDCDVDAVKVTDESEFAKSVLAALEEEEEDGSTRVHKMLDSAAEFACGQGYEGIEIAT